MKKILVCAVLFLLSFSSLATVVEMNTSHGIIKVNLFDEQTPITVANFLNYIESDTYNDTVIHRSVNGFIIQGGGFTYSDDFDAVMSNAPIQNEPVLSNVAGTIAMAKLSGDENSATNQWFFNLADNSANLDLQNGGFTVFGQIEQSSQATLDSIESLVHCDSIPVVNINEDQCSEFSSVVTSANLVTIYNVSVLDDDPNSSVNLSPVSNTLIEQETVTTLTPSTSESSGGAFIWLLPAFILVHLRRKRA
ncbi:peptidylprolyl isomerase [Pseudoalteromonas sp. MMG010]|uniref:peptidylprolyl isomerase n=1 Tax=Pseudoalteromonas sp. MMG010 TaxID=2822685 RepID=UPI001B39EAC0|nr:peptidylprolyl isomerase [Pseudoalteromonas sp. MMG010]MBQ4833710.1 peptidylprolyl isomerase [Pseudoalteromonas sp. MMG010]